MNFMIVEVAAAADTFSLCSVTVVYHELLLELIFSFLLLTVIVKYSDVVIVR